MANNYLAFGQPVFGREEIAAVNRTLKSGWIGMGEEVLSFEQELGEFLQVLINIRSLCLRMLEHKNDWKH